MPTTRSRPARTGSGGDLRPALALARAECAATLSTQLAAVLERAVRDPQQVVDRDWWASALAPCGRALDDDWARLAGPPVRRARARSYPPVTPDGSLRPASGAVAVTGRPGPVLLADAASAVLPGAPARRPARLPPRRRVRRRRRSPGSGLAGVAVSGSVLPGSLLSGSAVSAVVGVWRALPGGGLGTLLVLAGVLLLAGVAVLARIRAVRGVRARALAERVGAAVTAAVDRELVRRSAAAERAAGVPVPRPGGAVAALRRGAGRVA